MKQFCERSPCLSIFVGTTFVKEVFLKEFCRWKNVVKEVFPRFCRIKCCERSFPTRSFSGNEFCKRSFSEGIFMLPVGPL